MAITVNDLKERLEEVEVDIKDCNYGHALRRLGNLICLLERSGITIHAIATTESKKVESNDSQED